jgi:O-antigen/teichoic acid export membrane protein
VDSKQARLDLRTRAIKSTGWLMTFRLGSQLLSWAVTIIIARFLTPADYGLVAMALTVVAAIELLREFGLGAAIIQRQDLTAEHLNTIFWIVSLVSTVLVVILWVGAELAAGFYAEPRLLWVLRILGVTVLFNVFGFVPYALLTKEIDFLRRSVAAMLGAVSSSVVALSLAYLGYGVWALIAGQLVNAAILNAALLVAARWLPGLRLSFRNMGEILKFGLRLSAVSAIGLCSPIVNRVLVGRFLGGPALGLYTMAQTLAEAPNKLSSAVIHQLSLPIFAKLQRQDDELRKYFLKITKYLALTTLPAQVGMALVAYDLIAMLLTAQWTPMVALFQIFCVGSLFHILSLPTYPLLVARGRAGALLRFNAAAAIVTAAAIMLGSQIDLLAAGAAWLAAFTALKIVLLSLGLREVGIKTRVYFYSIAPAVVATIAMSATVLIVRHLGVSGSSAVQRLAFEVILGAFVYAGMLLVLDRKLLPEVRGIVHDLFSSSRA